MRFIQHGRGVGGVLKMRRTLTSPFTKIKSKSKKNKIGYYDECRACQKYGRVLHILEEEEMGYDNKGFINT